ncbi:hypothetical protein [Thermococcus sp.]
MRKSLSFFLIFLVLLDFLGNTYISAGVLYTKTIWLNRGDSDEYYYFTITLEDIDVLGSSAMIGVSGIQGSQDIVLQLSGQNSIDVFGDESITITLLDLGSSSAKITIAVDVEALANVAYNLLKNKIQEAEDAGLLPQSKIDTYKNSLDSASSYIKIGDYISAIDLCKTTITSIDEDTKLAKDAKKAIDNATLIINNPKLVDKDCNSCPESIVSTANTKLKQAKSAFDSGDFISARDLAIEAATLIEECCKSCKIYPDKEKSVENFLKSQSSEIPLDPAWTKINDAKREYENGDCIKAIHYLDTAKSLAEDIIKGWNNAKNCRSTLLSMISEATSKYVISYGTGTKIQIALADIEDRIYPEITEYMRKGYFSTAVTNCNALKTEVEDRIKAFEQTWEQMNKSYSVLTTLQSKGYKIDSAWEAYNKAIKFFQEGSYTKASVEFEKAKNIAEQIESYASEAQRIKNKTESCLLNLKTNGINVDIIFKEDINKAEKLYSSGDYTEAEKQWTVILKKCQDPDIANAIKQRKTTYTRYSQIKAEKIVIPSSISKQLQEADEYFASGKFKEASAQYAKVTEQLNNLERTAKDAMNEIKQSEEFLNSDVPQYEKISKLLGIPQLKLRAKILKESIENASKAYASGDYSKAAKYVSKIEEIRNDMDGDGIPDNVDILPQLPNYYLLGGIVVLLLFLINIFK